MHIWMNRPAKEWPEPTGVAKTCIDIHQELCMNQNQLRGVEFIKPDFFNILSKKFVVEEHFTTKKGLIVDILIDHSIAIIFIWENHLKRELNKIAKQYCKENDIKALIVVSDYELRVEREYLQKPCYRFYVGPVFGWLSTISDNFTKRTKVTGDLDEALGRHSNPKVG
jgi:hypothetical protein